MPASPDNEFDLAAACCIWPPSPRREAAIRAALARPVDWQRLGRVTLRHGVPGLVQDGLARTAGAVPAEVRRRLKTAADALLRRNMRQAAEAIRIHRRLDRAGLPHLFVKGATLAELAYGSLALKHSWDIDLLVEPARLPEAMRCLAEAGYRPAVPFPAPDDRRYRRWLEYGIEYILYHETGLDRETGGTALELHWRLAVNPTVLPGLTAASATRAVRVGGAAELPTPTDDELFAYLCAHGARHAWSRLKWLADVAALLEQGDAGDAERRLRAAGRLNVGIPAAQAFLLSDRLFGTPAVAAAARRLRRSRRLRWLERTALNAMRAGAEAGAPGGVRFGRLSPLLADFLLGRGWRFLAAELAAKANAPDDLLFAAPPPGPDFLYPLARLARWLARAGRLRALPRPPRADATARDRHRTSD